MLCGHDRKWAFHAASSTNEQELKAAFTKLNNIILSAMAEETTNLNQAFKSDTSNNRL